MDNFGIPANPANQLPIPQDPPVLAITNHREFRRKAEKRKREYPASIPRIVIVTEEQKVSFLINSLYFYIMKLFHDNIV